MEWLRWILLAIGMLTLVGIVVIYFRHRSEQAVVLGQGRDQGREDPIDAQLRGSHSLGDGLTQSAPGGAAEREDPLIDGTVGKARIVRRENPIHQDDPATDEAPVSKTAEPRGAATTAGASLFRQRHDDMPEPSHESAAPTEALAEFQPEYQADLFAERADSPLGQPNDALLRDDVPEGMPETEPAEEEPVETADTEVADQAQDGQPVVLSLLLAQRVGEPFNGLRLQQLIEEIGFEFGEFSIYHFSGEDGSPWFSLMNGLKPGTFDPNDVDSFSTPVLALFMQLPVTGGHPELVFERMLEVARDMADQLDAELLDDHREPISADSIDRYREQLIFF